MAFPLLYGIGWAFLVACFLLEQPLTSFYVASGLFFTLATAWALTALYTHDSLQKPRVRYPSNRTAPTEDKPRRRRRRRNKKARKVTGAISIALYLGTMYFHGVHFYKFLHPPAPDNFEVFVRGAYKLRALRVPPREDVGEARGMTFALANIPIMDLQVGPEAKTSILTVLIRNVARRRMDNVRIRIDTDGTITPGASYVAPISPTELEMVLPNVEVYTTEKGEVAVPLELKLPSYRGSAGLLVTIESDNGQPYAAAVKVEMARQSQ